MTQNGKQSQSDAGPIESESHFQQSTVLRAVPWPAVIVFTLLAWGLAWLVALPLWMGETGLDSPLTGILLPLMMFTPLVSALVVLFLVQKPRPRPVLEFLGMWPIRPLKRTIWMIVFGIFGSILIVIAGVFFSAALGFVTLDLADYSGYSAVLDDAGAYVEAPWVALLVLFQLLVLPFAALVNGVLALGEELGWRGWLLPSLRPLGTWPALLISGVIWGLWHSPIILLGYNFNQPNFFGVAMMVGGTVLIGTLLGWLRLRTASIWPAVFAHGALNAAGGFLILVVAANSTADPVATGPLGWVTWIVMAVILLVLFLTGQFSKQPLLEHRTRHTPAKRLGSEERVARQ